MVTSRRARPLLALAALGCLLVLTGCGARSVDVDTVGAEKIPGLGTAYRTCLPEGTLVYFTQVPGSWDDSVDYEAWFANACYRDPNGRIVTTYDVPAPAPRAQTGPIPDGDLGNTQPGSEEDD